MKMMNEIMNDRIDEWHESDSELSLPEFLGLSDRAFDYWAIHGEFEFEGDCQLSDFETRR